MKAFTRYLLTFAVLAGLISAVLPARFEAAYPKPPGPQFDSKIKLTYQKAIDASHPPIVLLGDSTLELGVDAPGLSAALGQEVYKIGMPGSASAVWYLALKNNIIQASFKPRHIVLFFRDNLLTMPGDRVTGRYFTLVDELADHSEPLVTELAYVNQMNPLDQFADRFLPVYGYRLIIKDNLERRLRHTLPGLLAGCQSDCAENAIATIFAADQLNPEISNAAVEDAERNLRGSGDMDFNRQVSASFLPEIIRLCRENGIQLTLVRTRTLLHPTPQTEPAALKQYITDLSTYLQAQDVNYLDFAHDERLGREYFIDAVHLSETGRAVFTRILGEALLPILQP